MKKSRIIAALVMGAAAGAGVCHSTEMAKRKAGKQGIHVPYGPYEAVIKRPLDVAFSFAALIALSPVIFITAVMVRLRLGSPVLFTQGRPGLDGKIFRLFKFRTMTDGRGDDGQLLPDGMRLTEFGKALRSTSLDELPELVNILRGEMSIVGPRPLLAEYLPRYNDRQKQRHNVRPGLTGLAQVNGRNGISWEEKFEDDVQYVEKITFLGDLRIMADTVKTVLGKTGISSGTSATMEPFMGSEEMK